MAIRLAQLLRAFCDVRILFWFGVSTEIEAKHLPQEVDYADANRK